MRAWSVGVLLLGLAAIGIASAHREVEPRAAETVLRLENPSRLAVGEQMIPLQAATTRAIEWWNRIDRWQKSIAEDVHARCTSDAADRA